MSFNFGISLSGINAARMALTVTQNNIANANTEGYARQRAIVAAQDAMIGGGVSAQAGSGVVVEKIERVKDDLLIEQVRSQGTRVSYFQTLKEGLSNIETIYGELEEGSISSTMQNFFSSWEELNKFPSESSYRQQVISAADNLAYKMNIVSQDLKTLRNEMDKKLEVDVEKANSLIEQLARVNEEISLAVTMEPNALLDKRDYYLDELSKIGNVRLIPNNQNPHIMDVEFGGSIVVSGTDQQLINPMYDKQGDRWVLAVNSVPMRLTEGSLVANLEVRNQHIPESQKKLDELANVIITEVNQLHESGHTLDGTTGQSFFVGINAATIAVSSAVRSNSDLVAISDVAGERGNANIGRQIHDLQTAGIMLSGKNPIEDWAAYSVGVGQKLNNVNDNAAVYESVLNDLKTDKQRIQGVDIDEELVKLIQYEKAYQVNAKMLQSIDKAFETLLNMV